MSSPRKWGTLEWGIVAAIAGVICAVVAILTFAGLAVTSNDPSSTGAINGTPSSARASSAGAQASSASPSPSPQAPRPQYNPVSLAILCSNQNAQSNFNDCSGNEIAVRIGQSVYDFSSNVFTSDDGSAHAALSFPASTCRSLSLRFSINPQSLPPSNLTVTVSVVQSGTRSVTIAPNQVGKLSVPLSSGPWEIDTRASLPMGGGWSVLMDGSASCSTSTGS
jgi:hypothetical protein